MRCCSQQGHRVSVTIEKTGDRERNTRNCFACVYIACPYQTVWGALTDYDRLGTFIPGQVRLGVQAALRGTQLQS